MNSDRMTQAAVDALYSLYNRTRFSVDDIRDLVCPMLQEDTINLLNQLYQWLIVDPSNIDEAKYLLLKKFSEVGGHTAYALMTFLIIN